MIGDVEVTDMDMEDAERGEERTFDESLIEDGTDPSRVERAPS
jgi:hypothetical protein